MGLGEFHAYRVRKFIFTFTTKTSTKAKPIGTSCEFSGLKMNFPNILIIGSKLPTHSAANEFFGVP